MKIKNLVIMGLALAMLVMPLSAVVQNVEAATVTPLNVYVDLPVHEGRHEIKTDGDFWVLVTLEETGEPVNEATVRWNGNQVTTDPFGWCNLVAPFVEKEKNYGSVEAAKVYKQAGIERSAYGRSEYPVVVIPYDLSKPGEFLGWWSHFVLTEEAQAMYTAAEVLGDWQNWGAIFGAKGGNLAKFIKEFPQFMVDRGKALEATHNMLNTIWALFTLLPAFVLALPQLLKTAPMRIVQFWPALFINLPIFMDGISRMVIDMGVFMTSLAPSVLMLFPQIFEKLPNIGPNALNIVLTAVELFFDVIPALVQYGAAALAAIPAFLIQMLQALFYSAPDIFGVVLGETVKTVKNLFRSWPLFPAGIAAGILAVAPALMMLPAYAPFVLLGRTLENTVAALGDWGQQYRETPSKLLDPIVGAFRVPGVLPRYFIVGLYLGVTGLLLLPALVIALGALGLSMIPLILLTIAIGLAPVFALLMFVPVVGWAWDVIWGMWMAASVIASFAATVPGKLVDILDYVVMRASIVLKMPGYAIGWLLQGILDIININFLGYLKDILGNIPAIIAQIGPIIKLIIEIFGTAGKAVAEVAAAPLPGV
jgi:hypothetical protein